MIYYQDGTLLIRNMEKADAQLFTDEETVQASGTGESLVNNMQRE